MYIVCVKSELLYYLFNKYFYKYYYYYYLKNIEKKVPLKVAGSATLYPIKIIWGWIPTPLKNLMG